MTTLHAVVLGLVQGLGEFLPISSSAHLVVLPRLLGWPDQGLSMDVAMHMGTLLALVVYFWKDLADLALGALKGEPKQRKMLLLILAATVPGGIAGLLLDDYVESVFRDPALIAGT
ncbi:MAG TPA: UDP-diphosphatase, partial [Elusimicrobia bacterium]|nr:UDP-diphosphatase [Elusimicrobiota bacterium]